MKGTLGAKYSFDLVADCRQRREPPLPEPLPADVAVATSPPRSRSEQRAVLKQRRQELGRLREAMMRDELSAAFPNTGQQRPRLEAWVSLDQLERRLDQNWQHFREQGLAARLRRTLLCGAGG